MDLKEQLIWDLKRFFETSLGNNPSPARLRFIAEVLMELREIMLLDDLNNTWTLEATALIERWLEKLQAGRLDDFDIVKELRNLKEFVANVRRKETEGMEF